MQKSDKIDNSRWEPDNFTLPVVAPPEWEVQDLLDAKDGKVFALIEEAVEPYKQTWKDGAMEEHSVYYRNIHQQLDYARQRCKEMDGKIEALSALNVGEEVTPEIRKIEKLRRPFAIIVHSVAAQFPTLESYLEHMRPLVEKELQQNMLALAERCGIEKLDHDKLDITCINNKQNNLVLSFLVKPEKGFNAQLVMTKGSSIQRVPHTRCVVSEWKPILSEQEKAGVVVDRMQENSIKTFDKRVTDALKVLLDECRDVYLKAQEDYFHLFQKKYPFIKNRYDELVAERAILNRLQAPRAKILDKLISSMGTIVNAKVADFKAVSAYIDNCRMSWDEKLMACVEGMYAKLSEKGFDVDSAKMKRVEMKENIVAFTLKDRLGNEADSRLILPVGNSIQKAPYLRIRTDDVRIAEKMQRSMTSQRNLMSLKQVEKENKPELTMENIPIGLVTEAKITEYNGKMFVTCHINGKRQTPAPLQPEEWKKYLASGSNDKTRLAIAHFQKEIGKSMTELEDVTRDEKRGMNR